MSQEVGISGPHISAAFLCEKVLVERDGVISFIRVVDRFTIPVFENLPPGVQVPAPVIQVTIAVALKAGSIGTGKFKVTVRGQKPDGSRLPDNNQQVFFQGGEDTGALLAFQVGFASPDEGLWWFDVYFESALLTRIPMRVLHQLAAPIQMPGMGQQ